MNTMIIVDSTALDRVRGERDDLQAILDRLLADGIEDTSDLHAVQEVQAMLDDNLSRFPAALAEVRWVDTLTCGHPNAGYRGPNGECQMPGTDGQRWCHGEQRNN